MTIQPYMKTRHPSSALDEAANYYYEVCGLYEDGDLDKSDTMKVIERAFTTSHCDDFASMLHDMTGFPIRYVVWPTKMGIAHHTVCIDDGKMVDVTGFVSLEILAKRYGIDRSKLQVVDTYPSSVNMIGDEEKQILSNLIAHLPHEPYSVRFHHWSMAL